MMNRNISYNYFQSSNKINRTLFSNDLIQVINEIGSKGSHDKHIKDIISFLENAREYSEGKIVKSYKFPPSEAFIYTLKALELNKSEKINEAINRIVKELLSISNGEVYKEEELVSFLKRLSESFEKDKYESNQLVSSLF